MRRMRSAVVMLTLFAVLPFLAAAQEPKLPVSADETILEPVTETIYVNTPDTINNGGTESLGVDVTNDHNVVVGWEDDGEGINDLEAVWTLYNSTGVLITPETRITAEGEEAMGKFLAFFRKDGSAVGGKHAWGPKIHANPFGPGFGMGATAFSLGLDIPELADINLQEDGSGGDFPAVQLLNEDGTPINTLSGVDDAYADRIGNIRIGDWEYLSNGNIVIVGESRQGTDLVERYGGEAEGDHAIYRIVTPQGNEVKAVSLVSETTAASQIWHGAASTQNGFAIRFNQGDRAQVRMFDNQGNPTSGNIDVGTLAGDEGAAGGGRGDGAGFHGFGNAYVVINSANSDEEPGNEAVHITVINADGTLRYHRNAAEGYELTNADRVDAAIDATGRVIAVWDDMSLNETFRIPVGRVFDAQGNPLSEVFYLSEKETLDTATGESRRPRAGWRDSVFAAVWESKNGEDPESAVVALRIFNIAAGTGIEHFSLY